MPRKQPERKTISLFCSYQTTRPFAARRATLAYVPPTSERRATVLTVLNLKGGVGKTHTTWLITSVCQERGKRVLLLDTDTQGNLSTSFVGSDDHQPRVEVLFDPSTEIDATSLVRRTQFENVDIIAADSRLARFDLSNQVHWEKADLHFSLIDAMAELRGHYDYIVIDCPPRLSLVSFAALCASDGVVIPMEAADWGAQGIMQVTEAIDYVQQRFNANLKLLGYVVSRFKRARAYQQTYLKQLRKHFGELAFDTVIPDLAKFEKSVTDRIPITLHAPTSPEANIAREFFDEINARAEGIGSGCNSRRSASVQPAAVARA